MDLIIKQRELMKEHYPDILQMQVSRASDLMIKAIIGELSELMEGYQYLPWKKPKVVNIDYMLEETVDILHFVLEQFIILGITTFSEVEELYVKKLQKNKGRGRIHQSNSHIEGD